MTAHGFRKGEVDEGPIDSAMHRSSSQAGLASMYTSGGAVTDHAPALPEAPTPDHGPLAATLSDRTLAKVLSRPAHVPSLVALDAGEHLAEVVSDYLSHGHGMPGSDVLRQALVNYRQAVAR